MVRELSLNLTDLALNIKLDWLDPKTFNLIDLTLRHFNLIDLTLNIKLDWFRVKLLDSTDLGLNFRLDWKHFGSLG